VFQLVRRTRRWRGVIAFVTAAVTVGAVAGPAKADVQPMDIVPGTHVCENFGATVAGYRAGHCVDLFFYRWSDGSARVRAIGQAFCQRASDAVIVQCAGIVQTSGIYDLWGRSFDPTTVYCGRYVNHDPPCPAGRFQHHGAEIEGYCPAHGAVVRTTIILPVSGTTQRSGNLFTPTSTACS
jgi:hypothetical protein